MLKQKQNSKRKSEKSTNYVTTFPPWSNKSAMVSRVYATLIPDYTELSDQATEATRMLSEISEMEGTIADLKNAQEQSNTDQNLPLPESIALLESHKANRGQVAVALERQTQENVRKRRQVEKLRTQLAEMEKQRVDAEMFAREAEKTRNVDNMQEELASRKQVGSWYDAVYPTTLRAG